MSKDEAVIKLDALTDPNINTPILPWGLRVEDRRPADAHPMPRVWGPVRVLRDPFPVRTKSRPPSSKPKRQNKVTGGWQ